MSAVSALKDMEKVMEAYAKSYAETQIEILCGHYKIDVNEAMELMKNKTRKRNELNEPVNKTNVETKKKKTKTKKKDVETIQEPIVETIQEPIVEAKKKTKKESKLEMEIELPFSGEIDEKRCQGIRTAGKLYTQCLTYTEEGVRYCKKCQKETEKNESGKPNNGDIEERIEVGLYEYKDKNGKNPWPYYKLMRKHGWSREYVEEIGEKYGIKIAEEHYNEKEMDKPVHQKGRQKGRPKKKEKKIVAVKELEEEAMEEKKEEFVEEKKEEIEEEEIEEEEIEEEEIEEEEEEDEQEIEEEEIEEEEEDEQEIVEEIEEEGKTYLRSKSSGLIYDAEDMVNPKIVGIWDSVRKKIDFSYEESSDEEE